MEETTKQEDCTRRSKSQDELEHLNRTLTEQLKQLTEKLNVFIRTYFYEFKLIFNSIPDHRDSTKATQR